MKNKLTSLIFILASCSTAQAQNYTFLGKLLSQIDSISLAASDLSKEPVMDDGDYGDIDVSDDSNLFTLDTNAVKSINISNAAILGVHIEEESIDGETHLVESSVTSDRLVSSGVAAGTYNSVTVTTKGLVVAATVEAGRVSPFKGVHESIDSANVNGISNTEGDYVIIYELGTYTHTEGDLVTLYRNPSTLGDSVDAIYNVGLYSTTALGLAAVADQEFFHVTTDGGITFTGYKDNAGSALATGFTGNVLPAFDGTNSGSLIVPDAATPTTYTVASYHNGTYNYNSSGYRGQYESLATANAAASKARNVEGDYVSIVKVGSGFTLSEGDLFTVYQNPSTNGTTLDATFNNRPMYSSTTVGQANTTSSEYYMVQNTATTATAYQNFGSANFVDNVTIGDDYDVSVSGKLAIPTTGLNVGANFGYATYINGSYDYMKTLRITSTERSLLTPYDGMQVYCTDCTDLGGDVGVMTVYQDSEGAWRKLY